LFIFCDTSGGPFNLLPPYGDCGISLSSRDVACSLGLPFYSHSPRASTQAGHAVFPISCFFLKTAVPFRKFFVVSLSCLPSIFFLHSSFPLPRAPFLFRCLHLSPVMAAPLSAFFFFYSCLTRKVLFCRVSSCSFIGFFPQPFLPLLFFYFPFLFDGFPRCGRLPRQPVWSSRGRLSVDSPFQLTWSGRVASTSPPPVL